MRRLTLLTCIGIATVAAAQTPELVPAVYLEAKYLAPPEAPASIVLAGPDEPGERLVVTGRVMYGTTPVIGASVFVFQTDAKGIYAPGLSGPDAELEPRIHGALRFGGEGQYQVSTIRPGSYDNNPAHLHYIVAARGFKPRIFDLWFQDDPILVQRLRAEEPLIQLSLRKSLYYKVAPDVIAIRPVTRDAGGPWRVVRDLDMIPE